MEKEFTYPISFQELEKTAGWFESVSRKIIFSRFKLIKRGIFLIHEGENIYSFGNHDSKDLTAEVFVNDKTLYTDFLVKGSIGIAEAFMNNKWESEDLTKVIRLFVANLDVLDTMESGFSTIFMEVFKGLHRLSRNTITRSKENISRHYDLGNDLFKLFLDSKLMYSSAVFENEDSSLEDAAAFKLKKICDRLKLSENDHLLEIGTGWGGLSIYAAKNYNCKVTTTTISKEQFNEAKLRIEAEGLQDKITLLLEDYRNLTGQFDKIVSVEMIEAVGHEYYGVYFKKCFELLKDGGEFLIQAILINDQRFDYVSKSVDFIQKYIFPGGALPAVSALMDAVKKQTMFQLVNLDDITMDYAKTLRLWRERFFAKLDEVKKLGYDDTFVRMWHYYLCYCEGGFLERSINTVHMSFLKPDYNT